MSIRDLFKQFVLSDDLVPIVAAYNELVCVVTPNDPSPNFETLRSAVVDEVPFIHKRLFHLLSTKWEQYASRRDQVMEKDIKRVVVSGGGPCGLVSSVELAMLGFSVNLVEKRSEFSRHNILKTWACTVDYLVSLGFKTYYPKFQANGTHAMGTKEIQNCLLKTCLLLGVKFHYNEAVIQLADPSVEIDGKSGEWVAIIDNTGAVRPLSLTPAEKMSNLPEELALQVGGKDVDELEKTSKVDYFEPAISEEGAIVRNVTDLPVHSSTIAFDYFVVAEGESSRLIRHLGFGRNVTRYGPGIGVVVNLDIDTSDSSQQKLEQFVVTAAQERNQKTIQALKKIGIEVENMEYLRFSTHFIVATALKANLQQFGVLKEDRETVKEALSPSNIDFEKLRTFARGLSHIAGIPASSPFSDKHGVNIFDFSCKGKLKENLRILPFHDKNADTPRHSPIVLPVGDTLSHPFWPQGLGVNGGFHSSLDAVWTIFLDATDCRDAALAERTAARLLWDWYPLQMALFQPGSGWEVDPLTRYAPRIGKSLMLDKRGRNQPVPLTERMIDKISSQSASKIS